MFIPGTLHPSISKVKKIVYWLWPERNLDRIWSRLGFLIFYFITVFMIFYTYLHYKKRCMGGKSSVCRSPNMVSMLVGWLCSCDNTTTVHRAWPNDPVMTFSPCTQSQYRLPSSFYVYNAWQKIMVKKMYPHSWWWWSCSGGNCFLFFWNVSFAVAECYFFSKVLG